MAAGAALFVVGTGLKIYGQYKANQDEAASERENSLWLEEQAEYAKEATEREIKIFGRESDILVSEQIGGFAKAGVEMSGSALGAIGASQALVSSELAAIEKSGKMKVREALLKSKAARAKAEALEDPTNNFLQAGGTVLTGGAQFL